MAPRPEKQYMSKRKQKQDENFSHDTQKERPHNHCRRSARLHQRYQSCGRETEPKERPATNRPGDDPRETQPTRKQKRAAEEPLGRPAERSEKRRQTNLADLSENAVNGIERQRSADFPPSVQAVNPELFHRPRPSPKEFERKRPPEHERPSEKPQQRPKRPRTDKDGSVEHWIVHDKWPGKSLEPDPMEQSLAPFVARPKSLRRTKSNASLTAPSETSSRETKSNAYTNKNCEIFLETKGSFLDNHKDGITRDSKIYCQELLKNDPEIPKCTVFEEHAFESTCARLRKKNETGVIRIVGELIVPSAESAVDLRHTTCEHLVVSMNEGWDSSISLDEAEQPPEPLPPPQFPQLRQRRLPRPQPDYAVGFSRHAFTDDQLHKLAPYVGEVGDTSFFMGTAYMYFPFLTSEVKCGKAALDIADRQNAHSMTLSVRGVVMLFRLVKREKELHREILAFSVSHDHRSVRIYGHYPAIAGEKTTYYRHSIHSFDLTALDGRDRWASYKFVMGVYNDWAPSHFKRLCSVIDRLPEGNLDTSQQSEELQQSNQTSSEVTTGLSQEIEGVGLGSSFTSQLEEESQPQQNEGESTQGFKVPRKRRK